MFLIILLLTCACAEWVEISQQHYRKPIRTTFNVPVIKKSTELFQPAKPHRTYVNETIQDHVWSKGNINKVPKLGNVQRVQLDAHPVKAPSLRDNVVKNGDVALNFANKNKNSVKEIAIVPLTNKQEDYNLDSFYEFNVQKPPIDSMKNNIKINEVGESAWNTELNQQNGERYKDTDLDKNQKINKVRDENKSANDKNLNSNRRDFINKDENRLKGKKNTVSSSTSATDIFTQIQSESNAEKENTSNRRTNQSNKNFSRKQIHKVSDSKTNEEITKFQESIKYTRTPANTQENIKSDTMSQEQIETSGNEQPNGVENMIKFVKIVADTIRKNTRSSVSSKTKYLENLKESILANIEDHIDAAWPDDDAKVRQRRAAQGTSRGHLQIPSSESALMTISFLTFAVFLIKLVLQLIQTYKHKAMMVAPTVVATVGRTARKHSSLKPQINRNH